jgi:hypothetical protein
VSIIHDFSVSFKIKYQADPRAFELAFGVQALPLKWRRNTGITT